MLVLLTFTSNYNSMNIDKENQKIEKSCQAALEKFQKIGIEKYDDIQSKLEFVLGSYHYDHNPVGLYEYGEKALKLLKAYKKEKPKAVSDKLINDLENAVNKK